MNIFVTGATGFIGRHLVANLRAQKHTVHFVDSKSAPLLDPLYLDVFDSTKFDRIYHLAAYTRAGDFCARFGGDQWLINQKLNTNILSWWQKHQPQAHFVTFGTSASYPAGLELREENYLKEEPLERFYAYAMSKRMLLVGLRALAQQYGLKFSYVIPSTVYGAGYHTDGRDLHFIYDLIFKILKGKNTGAPVTLWGDGHQTRELIHVRDILGALEAVVRGPGNEIYNLGTGEAHSIREFASLICDEVGYDFGQIGFDESRYVGLRSKVLVPTRLLGLGYKFKVGLPEGLRETISWCAAQPLA